MKKDTAELLYRAIMTDGNPLLFTTVRNAKRVPGMRMMVLTHHHIKHVDIFDQKEAVDLIQGLLTSLHPDVSSEAPVLHELRLECVYPSE